MFSDVFEIKQLLRSDTGWTDTDEGCERFMVFAQEMDASDLALIVDWVMHDGTPPFEDCRIDPAGKCRYRLAVKVKK